MVPFVHLLTTGFGPSRPISHEDLTSAFDAVDGSSTRHVTAMDVGAVKGSHDSEELSMQTVTTSVSISRSRFFRSMALMLTAKWSSAAS